MDKLKHTPRGDETEMFAIDGNDKTFPSPKQTPRGGPSTVLGSSDMVDGKVGLLSNDVMSVAQPDFCTPTEDEPRQARQPHMSATATTTTMERASKRSRNDDDECDDTVSAPPVAAAAPAAPAAVMDDDEEALLNMDVCGPPEALPQPPTCTPPTPPPAATTTTTTAPLPTQASHDGLTIPDSHEAERLIKLALKFNLFGWVQETMSKPLWPAIRLTETVGLSRKTLLDLEKLHLYKEGKLTNLPAAKANGTHENVAVIMLHLGTYGKSGNQDWCAIKAKTFYPWHAKLDEVENNKITSRQKTEYYTNPRRDATVSWIKKMLAEDAVERAAALEKEAAETNKNIGLSDAPTVWGPSAEEKREAALLSSLHDAASSAAAAAARQADVPPRELKAGDFIKYRHKVSRQDVEARVRKIESAHLGWDDATVELSDGNFLDPALTNGVEFSDGEFYLLDMLVLVDGEDRTVETRRELVARFFKNENAAMTDILNDNE